MNIESSETERRVMDAIPFLDAEIANLSDVVKGRKRKKKELMKWLTSSEGNPPSIDPMFLGLSYPKAILLLMSILERMMTVEEILTGLVNAGVIFGVKAPVQVVRNGLQIAKYRGLVQKVGHLYWAVTPEGYRSVEKLTANPGPGSRSVKSALRFAKARGVRLGGPVGPRVLTEERKRDIGALRDLGKSFQKISREVGVSATTVRRFLTSPERRT